MIALSLPLADVTAPRVYEDAWHAAATAFAALEPHVALEVVTCIPWCAGWLVVAKVRGWPLVAFATDGAACGVELRAEWLRVAA